jgi:hypothetical protein
MASVSQVEDGGYGLQTCSEAGKIAMVAESKSN